MNVKKGKGKWPDYWPESKAELFEPKVEVSRSRIEVKCNWDVFPDGKTGKDFAGVIGIREGKEDLDLGPKKYSLVVIAIEGGYYIHGMAIYMPDEYFEPGIDIIFFTGDYPWTWDQTRFFLAQVVDDEGYHIIKHIDGDYICEGSLIKVIPAWAKASEEESKEALIDETSYRAARSYLRKEKKNES